MSREQERAKRKLEKNPVVECNKIQNKYYPELFKKFSEDEFLERLDPLELEKIQKDIACSMIRRKTFHDA